MAAATAGEEANVNSNLIILWDGKSENRFGSIMLPATSTMYLCPMMAVLLPDQPVARTGVFIFPRNPTTR